MAQSPLFLERRSYRRRRMMDAVRVLPLVIFALWMVPLLWGLPGEIASDAPVPMSTALRYVFGIWLLMVAAGWALWWRTRTPADPAEPPG